TPVLYKDLQIDHLVPERISETELTRLREYLRADFQINSIENWVTCHQGCNLRKSSTEFETKALLYYLQMARNRAVKVQSIIDRLRRAQDNDKLLSNLAVRIEQGNLTRLEVLTTMRVASQPALPRDEPSVIAFGVNLHDPLPVGAPENGPNLSDWLTRRLKSDLAATGAIFKITDDERTGETLSVRCALWVFDFDVIREQIDFCWDVLAVQPYSEVFPGNPEELLDQAVAARYRSMVYDPSDGALGLSACPLCGSRQLERGSFVTERYTIYVMRCKVCGHSESS
ncbi:MAG TPA: hypothetical protein VGP89_19290, partial [Candidatus Angelobacter sp.]|nr:hypothetical protein [Candidatus Angelobacter sp.]